MGRALHDASPLARELFARADDVLGTALTSLCFDGPQEALRRTENAQPALFAVSAIACVLLREHGIEPVAAAGHSAGEYAALFAAGALAFDDGLRAVRRRGELMANVSARTPGTMAAIAGLSLEAVERLCEEASALGVVEVANENSPSQTVVAGEPAAVERVMDLAEEREGGTAMPLAVSGAFHSSLMKPIVPEMVEVLASTPLSAARIPVIANATAGVVRTPAEIRDALLRQIDGRVRWGASVRRLADAVDTLVEVGPGRKLTRLARELAPGLTVRAVDDLLVPDATGS
jgi:[acyl-carrier-protein] S-malonyltransferase